MTATAWANRIVGHGDEAPGGLLANPANWRLHPKEQQDALAGVLFEVGWVQDIIVNRRSGHVVDGHLRVSLALRAAADSVPVVYVDLDPAEEALILATLDPLAAMATTDDAKLAELLADITLPDEAELEGLAALLASLGPDEAMTGLTDPDDTPEPAEDPYVKAGDLYVLGEHRLLCGDATSPDDVARVLGGKRPALTVTDPPYGVEYDASWRRKVVTGPTYREGKVANDDRADWTEAMVLMPGDVAYVWHGGLHAGVVAGSLSTAGFDIRSQIIWSKPSLILSRGAYHWQHEPAWFAVRNGATAHWVGDRKQSTVWDIPTVHRTAGTSDDAISSHSTQKPIECMARPLRNHAGDVYDPFVGSGTTIIAAEQTGRRCFAMEIDPVYVQMAIERWQNFTGRQAMRLP
jgi:DNA modification methylase